MDLTTFLTITTAIGPIVGILIGGLATWLRLGSERRKAIAEAQHLSVDTHSQVLEDLNKMYLRVCDDLAQTQMRLKGCETENEICKGKVQELTASVSLLQGQTKLFLLCRARSHLAIKTLGNYELHVDYLLDEMRTHGIAITSKMRTQALRTTYQIHAEKLESMEAQELEVLLKRQIMEETPTTE